MHKLDKSCYISFVYLFFYRSRRLFPPLLILAAGMFILLLERFFEDEHRRKSNQSSHHRDHEPHRGEIDGLNHLRQCFDSEIGTLGKFFRETT